MEGIKYQKGSRKLVFNFRVSNFKSNVIEANC